MRGGSPGRRGAGVGPQESQGDSEGGRRLSRWVGLAEACPQTAHNSLGAQLSALGELSHRWGGAPALRVALLHRPALGASLPGGLCLLEPLPQLRVPVSRLPPALSPQLRPQRGGEPGAARAHLRLLFRGLQWVPR